MYLLLDRQLGGSSKKMTNSFAGSLDDQWPEVSDGRISTCDSCRSSCRARRRGGTTIATAAGVGGGSCAGHHDGSAYQISEPIEIAAAYLFYICSNHPFVDGNKRVSLASCLVFLSENGLLPDESLNIDSWEKLTLDVACGSLTRDEVTVRLRTLLQ